MPTQSAPCVTATAICPSGKVKFAGIGGASTYIKTTAEAGAYTELLPDWGIVGSAKVEGGHIYGIGDDRLRVSEQFMVGGNIIRGFENQGIGPRDSKTGDAIGGRMYIAG